MASDNELLDQQIHDAFERVAMSEEAQRRMLARLMTAQLSARGEDDRQAVREAGEESAVLVGKGLAMASPVDSRGTTPAARRMRQQHLTHDKVPAIDEVQSGHGSSDGNSEDSMAIQDAANGDSSQKAAAVSRKPRGKHFRVVEGHGTDETRSSYASSGNGAASSGAADLQATSVRRPRKKASDNYGSWPRHLKEGLTVKMQKVRPVRVAPTNDIAVAYIPADKKTYGRPKKKAWRRVLPLAAVLLVAFVVVQASVVWQGSKNKSADRVAEESAKSVVAESDSVDAAGVAEESELLTNADGAVAPEVSAPAGDEPAAEEGERDPQSVDYYPLIMMADGTRFTALRDGQDVEEVDVELVESLVGSATATSFDAPDEVATSCLVYELQEEGTYAVQYDGEDSYWRCTIIGS